MRTPLFAAGILILSVFPGFAFSQNLRCGNTEYHERMQTQDPGVSRQLRINEELLRKAMDTQASSRTTTTIYTIPVVFHVLWRTAQQNISTLKIHDQLATLNADYGRFNADTTLTPSAFRPTAAASNIRFCMATRDPNGNWTNGIIRKQVTATGYDPLNNDNVKYSSLGGDDAWPTSDYLNIWVCNFVGASMNILGISQMPGLTPATDGCVVLYSTVGGTTYPGTLVDFDLGRTLTHEVGHWFALYHIWGDDGGGCTGTDYVSDTPNQADENYGCPGYPQLDACATSSPGAMFMNYMDYVNDDCMNMFTSGQVTRLHNALASLRSSLMGTVGCWPPVGLTGPEAGTGFTVYPNPSNGHVEASATFPAPTDLVIRVENTLGQVVYSRNEQQASRLSLDLDLSGQPSGLYFVTLRSGAILETRRLLLTGF